MDEMDLLRRLKDTEAPRPEAFEQARMALRSRMAYAEPELAPLSGPAPAGARHRSRRLARVSRRTFGIGLGISVAAAAVAAALVVTSTPQPAKQSAAPSSRPTVGATQAVTPSGKPTLSPALNVPLTHLADFIESNGSHSSGDASLVIRNQTNGDGQVTGGGVDLYTDSGTYYYGPTEGDLQADVEQHLTANDGGVFEREVAAALYAVHGNLAIARSRMHWAPLTPGTKQMTLAQTNAALKAQDKLTHVKYTPEKPLSPEAQQELTDKWIWDNSLATLNGAAGNPQVRVGVLRLLATLPRATVTNTATDGERTLTVTDTWPKLLDGKYKETLTINANSGVPVIFVGSDVNYPSQNATITYQVSRVTVAGIAAGKF